MRAAQLATFAQRMAVGSLPSRDIELEPTEAPQLVAEFRMTRDRYRGALAAPVTELAAPPERIATAIFGAAENASDDEKHRLAEDLVDLQAFVDLPSEPVVKPQRGELGSPTLTLVAARQAAAIAFVTRDERVVGVGNAIRGMWLAIGEARAGLTATATYKDAQMAGILAMVVWPVVAVPATLVAIWLGLGTFSWLVIAAFAGGWILAPYAGKVAGSWSAALDRLRPAHTTIAMAVGLSPVILWPLAVSVGAVALSGMLGLG